jgi:hypothetical protein
MSGVTEFLFDVALALVTLAGTATLLWGWFLWLAGKAEWVAGGQCAPRAPGRPSIASSTRGEPDAGPPSASQVARAEIAELESLWELSRGVRGDPHRADGTEGK